MLLFGCEDGALRLWCASAHAVIQCVRPSALGLTLSRPITSLVVFCSLPGGGGGGVPLSARCALGAAAAAAGVYALAGSAALPMANGRSCWAE
jgi:hypothetical protein